MEAQQTRQGIWFALGAYFAWGIAPSYFKLIEQISPNEILTYRVIWSFFFMLILISWSRNWATIRILTKNPKKLGLLALSALLIASNWWLFIWAINNEHMLDASLGYFINPLVNLLLAIIFLGERFRTWQWIAVCLAGCGVLTQIWQFGSIPVIALGLALTFSFYGLIRKKIAVDAQMGMLVETLWLLPFSIIYTMNISTHSLTEYSLSLNLLLVALGILTTVPLLLFAAAANRLRFSTLSFFQYLGPTLIFLQAILFYGEQMSTDKLITFGFIWGALVLFILDAQYQKKHQI